MLSEVQKTLLKSHSCSEDTISYQINKDVYFWQKKQSERYISRIRRNIQNWHKNNKFDPYGKTIEELSGLVSEYPLQYRTIAATYVLQHLTEDKVVRKKDNTYILKDHKVVFSVENNKALQWLENYFKFSGMKTPLWSEMVHKAKYKEIDEKLLKQLCTYLQRRGKVYFIEDSYIYFQIVDECRIKLLEYLIHHEEGITVGQYRDLLNANRKIVLLLLAIFDIEGIIRREEDYRFITEKGRQFLNNPKEENSSTDN
jgi:hypothetical protein